MRSHSERQVSALQTAAACIVLLGFGGLAAHAATDAGPLGTEPGARAAAPLASLAEASRQSRLSNKPLMALAMLRNCPYCRALEKTLATDAVIERLQKFILYRFDIELNADEADELDVQAAPSVLILTPSGMRVARHEGYVPPEAFIAWLDDAEKKMSHIGADMARQDPKDLVGLLAGQDPVLREAVTQALVAQIATPSARATVTAVVEAFAQGNLAARLGTMELLRLWGAPVQDADPWKPETVAPVLDGLRKWSQTADVARGIQKPSPAEIERDLQLWTAGKDTAATRAAYERLARVGQELLPKVRQMVPPTWDMRRERLTALRYRLLMPVAMATALPQAPFQLATRDADLRAQALDAVAKAVRLEGRGADLQGFFLEAFSDPDSKVREAALRGLRETGAGLAKENVLRLLEDPSPNVRAGVLNDLARSPLPDMAGDLAAYSSKETDEDLVVHAVRALREIRDRTAALHALVKLAQHPSWRVRAEAVESLGSTSSSRRGLASLPQAEEKALVATAIEKALRDDDPFVAGKAVEVLRELSDVDLSNCLDALIAITEKHPALTLQALEAVAQNQSLKAKAVEPIKKLCRHPKAEVRAAALHTLAACTQAPVAAEVLAGLADPEPSVRAAAASSIHEAFRYSGTQSAASLIPEDTRKAFIAALRKLASAEDPKERFASLRTLAVLGDTDIAFPGIEEMIAKDPALGSDVVGIVRLLNWDKRKKIFEILRRQPVKDEDWGRLFSSVFLKAPESEEGLLWEVFEKDPHVLASPDSVLGTIVEFYGIQGGLWNTENKASEEALARLSKHAREQLAAASVGRKIMGLILLCRAKRKEGEAEARAIFEAPSSAAPEQAELRRAAVEILLNVTGPEQENLAMTSLSSPDAEVRKSGMRVLLAKHTYGGRSATVHVGDKPVWVAFLSSRDYSYALWNQPKTPWNPPKLPEKLTADLLRPFLEAEDPDLKVGASYLLAVLGDGSGLPNLIAAWRDDPQEEAVRTMLARAISALGDDHNTKYLREMYESLDENQRQDFGTRLYWTMRRVQGSEAETLRRNMRKEIGASLVR